MRGPERGCGVVGAKERASSSRAEGGTRCAVQDEQKKEARRLTYPMRRLYSTKCLVPRLILESHLCLGAFS